MNLLRIKYCISTVITLFCFFGTVLADENRGDTNIISIHGSSNVNEFTLVNKTPLGDFGESNSGDGRYRKIKIAVNGFTAENKRMVDDFREMVNAAENPYIKIALEKRNLADFEETSGLTNFNADITIAGISRKYIIPLEVISSVSEGYTVKGNFSLELSDFGIDPPEKLFGLVKVKNDVFINFTFKFDSEESVTKNQQF